MIIEFVEVISALLVCAACAVMILDGQQRPESADMPVLLADCECVPRHKGAR